MLRRAIAICFSLSLFTFAQSHADEAKTPTRSELKIEGTAYVECLAMDVHADIELQELRVSIDGKGDGFSRTKLRTSWEGYIFTENYTYMWRVEGVSNHVSSFSGTQIVKQSARQQNVKAAPLGDNPYGSLRFHNIAIDVYKWDGNEPNTLVNKAVGSQIWTYGIECLDQN